MKKPDKLGHIEDGVLVLEPEKVWRQIGWNRKAPKVGEIKRLVCALKPHLGPWFDMDDGGGNHYHHDGEEKFCSGKLFWQSNFAMFAA